MRKRIIAIRHHGLRHIEEEDIESAIDETYGGSPSYRHEEIDTSVFGTDQDGVNWELAHEEIWKRAGELCQLFKSSVRARISYFGGYPEVPAAVALGAYIGEEWQVETYDLREKSGWLWPTTTQSLTLNIENAPLNLENVEGPAVLVVEISGPVLDAHISQFVRVNQSVATIRVGPASSAPQYADLIRSPADVAEVRRAIRIALATLLKLRPGVTTLHVFIAAPPSAAFAIGQELRIRNSRPVQTYRHRNSSSGPTMSAAILLTPSGPTDSEEPLTEQQTSRATSLRTTIWTEAVRDLESYSALKRQDSVDGEYWFDRLIPREMWARVRPFPPLPTVYAAIAKASTVDSTPLEPPNDYSYNRNVWKVSDRLLLRLDDVFGGDPAQLGALIRMFMLHEASHKQHSLVKGKVDEVGKFPNCLERADYTADLYAIIHEVDRGLATDARPLHNFELLRSRVDDLIDLVIRSFWAFEAAAPVSRIEIRRLRRHLNWYWQQARVQRAENMLQLCAILSRQPFVELAGLEQSVVGRRVYCSLSRLERGGELEMGIILDNEELWRVKNSVTVPLLDLVNAMQWRDHVKITKVFGRIFEDVAGSKNALPDIRYVRA